MCTHRMFISKKTYVSLHADRKKKKKANPKGCVLLGGKMELGRLSLVGVYIFVLVYCFLNMYYVYKLTKSNKYSILLAKQNTL